MEAERQRDSWVAVPTFKTIWTLVLPRLVSKSVKGEERVFIRLPHDTTVKTDCMEERLLLPDYLDQLVDLY